MDENASFSEGDVIERDIPGGRTERYRIVEAAFQTGISGIPDNWVLDLEKTNSAGVPAWPSKNHSPVVISNSNVQIGNGNVMSVQEGLGQLIQLLDRSAESESSKKEAKSKIKALLEHPAVVAVLGGVASGLAAVL